MSPEDAAAHVALANISIKSWLKTGNRLTVRIEDCGTRASIQYDPHAESMMLTEPISGATFPIDESCEKFIARCYEQICKLL